MAAKQYGTVRFAQNRANICKLPAPDWSGIIREEIREKAMASLDAIVVHAVWDEEASVWVATSDDIDGLVVEAATMEALEPKVKAALSDLIELNGPQSSLHEIPVRILAEQTSRIANPHAA
ncbi:hypothetical protein J2T09_004411 [Neorhizobium huautlense]|uniref:DUF1902 domain-containing protein n=1 Tax=Neorhizobium huautlense TaxID=67774 RepID=A0ABT9PYR6_9HYPH|nr:DUF1902 domain-containing protein [Neorhizobium huautlense]MDP9839635.1 hypothetical protein [Neorhizobium huautlense]